MTTKEERAKLIDLAGRIPALPYILRICKASNGLNRIFIELDDESGLICQMQDKGNNKKTAIYIKSAANMAPALAKEVDELTAGYDAVTNPPECIRDLWPSYSTVWSDDVLCLTTDEIFVVGYHWQNRKDPSITGWNDNEETKAGLDVIRWWPLPKVER